MPGVKEDQNSYISKLTEISDILVTLSIIICQFHIKKGHIEISLDGESALDKALTDNGLHCEQKSFNILKDTHKKKSFTSNYNQMEIGRRTPNKSGLNIIVCLC